MRIGFVADVHLGNHRRHAGDRQASLNRRCREGLAVFERAAARSVELGCAAFVVLGDLVDVQRPEPQLLAAAQRVLAPMTGAGCRPYLLVGNHDQVSDAAGDHALGPLAPHADVVDRPTAVSLCGLDADQKQYRVQLGLVPFRAGAPAVEWLPGVVRELMKPGRHSRPDRRVLGVHLGVRDGRTAPWLADAPDAVPADLLADLAAEAAVGRVFAGNWHDRREWSFDGPEPDEATGGGGPGVRVLQLGALTPTGWDNPGLDGYGTLAVWEDGAVRVESLPGPRFVKSDAAGLGPLAAQARAAGHRLYVEVSAPPEGVAAAVLALHRAAGTCVIPGVSVHCDGVGGTLVDGPDLMGEVVVDGAAVQEQAREAAGAASSAGSMEAGLAAFLEGFPLEPGVDRAAVSAAVRGYLNMPGGAC